MRVVGGEARGRRLKPPCGRSLRPTSDRVREAIFDLVGPGPYGDKILDLFAGTGALGIEALSRGFRLAVFVESNRTALGLIRENLARSGFAFRSRVVARDVFNFLKRLDAAAPFDLVLVDPPYGQGLVSRVLDQLGAAQWVAKTGTVVCEGERELDLPDRAGALVRTKHKRYGDTSVHLYLCS